MTEPDYHADAFLAMLALPLDQLGTELSLPANARDALRASHRFIIRAAEWPPVPERAHLLVRAKEFTKAACLLTELQIAQLRRRASASGSTHE